ncbi:MAG: long-chain fatty acid--CoA ligase [Jatrophihabitans sp.]|nr:long-chain fatty acid--CoA ligase [Jatrophihabitans sp.]
MIELLRRAAEVNGTRPAIITDDRTIDYPALLAQAEGVAASLQARGIDRFGVLDHDAIDVVVLLAAASLVGAEMCLYPPLETGAEVVALAARVDHHVVVTNQELSADGVDLVLVSELDRPRHSTPAEPPAVRPLLVFTTGTTGEPRAARHDWWRLLRPYAATPPAPAERWLLAYGLHQFGGLQLVLHVMASAATLVAPVPRRPREGLAAMRRHDVDHASATPTFWRWVLAELRRDGGPVPELRQVTLGGEAVPSRLLTELETTFPKARISQVYAANEAGSMRSIRDGRNGLPLSALHERPDAAVALKIVDGELWVRSRTGMLGYHGEAGIEPDSWRATGDLVEVVGDRVLFRGRSTEIINVGGVKVHPLPIEERVSAVPGVEFVRVFGRPSPLAGAIVAIEIVPRDGADTDEIDAAVRDACADLPAAAQPRSIRFVAEIATTGSKVRRS